MIRGAHALKKARLTPSRWMAFGVEMRISSASDTGIPGLHGTMAKAQKFMAFTGMMCWIHGFGRSSGTASRGSARLSESSSEGVSFQTMSSLSRPWLLPSQI